MTSGFIVIKVDLAEGSTPEQATEEVFDLVGNMPLDHVEYVLSATWNPSPDTGRLGG